VGLDTPIKNQRNENARIRLLPDNLIDQIAAGEVVERPASVVKELVENALDADARRVRVELREGGNAFMAVADDGIGMTPAEAGLALQRHATSKIAGPDDLQRIASFGFRGEALPAIASVSRLRVVTRPREAPDRDGTGHELRVENGRIVLDRAAGCPVGTRIEVADLFAGVPARRKFLKRPSTEWGHAFDWLGRLALALPGVHLEVVRDDREVAVWPATDDPFARIEAVLGREAASGLLPVTREEPDGHVDAWLSPPDLTRANANAVHLYVNGRPVRDRLLRHAVLEAYRDWLPRGRHPVAVVMLSVDPAEVDVNVHPAKWEVRFGRPQAIHALVRHAVRDAMSGRDHLIAPGRELPESVSESAPESVPEPAPDSPVPGRDDRWRRVERAGRAEKTGRGDWIFSSTAAAPTDRVRESDALPATEPAPAGRADPLDGSLALSSLPLLGQMLASYLVLEADQGMILIDQHAAHERVLYERLRMSWLEAQVERQGLLIPVTVELDPLAVAALEEAGEAVAGLGFEVERFGENAVAVRAIPALLAGNDPAALVRDLAGEIAAGEGGSRTGGPEAASTRLVGAADRLFATLACHSARRFGDHLPPEEQRAILEGLDSIPWAQTCPHGRPVAMRISRSEIERRFGRS